MVRPAAGDADAERRDLGAVDIDPGGAGAARGASAQEIDHRLFEQAHEGFDLQPAASGAGHPQKTPPPPAAGGGPPPPARRKPPPSPGPLGLSTPTPLPPPPLT